VDVRVSDEVGRDEVGRVGDQLEAREVELDPAELPGGRIRRTREEHTNRHSSRAGRVHLKNRNIHEPIGIGQVVAHWRNKRGREELGTVRLRGRPGNRVDKRRRRHPRWRTPL